MTCPQPTCVVTICGFNDREYARGLVNTLMTTYGAIAVLLRDDGDLGVYFANRDQALVTAQDFSSEVEDRPSIEGETPM
jgi:hypothetical protein